jgi:hypothetical protein
MRRHDPNPRQLKAISQAQARTYKVGSRVLADLLAADLIPTVWVAICAPGRCAPRVLTPQVAGQAPHVRPRSEISACRSANSREARRRAIPLAAKARAWLTAHELPADERRFAEQVECAYERLVADRAARGARAGAARRRARISRVRERPSPAAGRLPLKACTSLRQSSAPG